MTRLSIPFLLYTASLLLVPHVAAGQSKASYTVGTTQLCMLDEQGQVSCTISTGSERLRQPSVLPDMIAITAGDTHACGISSLGEPVCWGSNIYGQLDIPSVSEPLVKINAGQNHTCAIDVNGEAICWGLNSNTQLEPPEGARFIEIDAVSNSSCGILDNGNITCWTNDARAAHESLAGPFTDLDAQGRNVCGLTSVGSIECFSNTINLLTPPTGNAYIDVAVTREAVCGLTTDGVLDCSFVNQGLADSFPLGEQFLSIQSDETDTRSGIRLSSGLILQFGTTMCGERSDGTIQCWNIGSTFPDPDSEIPSTLDLIETMEFDLDARIYGADAVEIFWTPLPIIEEGRLVVQPPRVEVFRNGELLVSRTAQFSYFDQNAPAEAEYRIRLTDGAGNTGELSDPLSVNTSTGTVLFNGEPPILAPPIDEVPNDIFVDAALLNGIVLSWNVEPELEQMIDGYIVAFNGRAVAFTRSKLFVTVSQTMGSGCFDIAAVGFDGSVIGRRGVGTCG